MSFVGMCEQLARSGVRFVVVGGVAAIAQGSARDTHDLDICYEPEEQNLAKLVQVLKAWKARLRVPDGSGASLPFVIDARMFRDSHLLTLETDLGLIDLMDCVAGGGDFATVWARSEAVALGPVEVRVLTLDALIASKRAVARRQDREHLIELEAIRAIKQIAEKESAKRRPRR